MKKLITTILLSTIATNVFAANLSTRNINAGLYRTSLDSTDQIVVTANNKMIITEQRQVGSENSTTIPFPTVCRYTYLADIYQWNKEDDEISISVNQIYLVDGDNHCSNFLKQEEKLISQGWLNYTIQPSTLIKLNK